MNKELAARYLNISPRTLQRYMARRKIRFSYKQTKKGREAIFNEADLHSFKNELPKVSVVQSKRSANISQSGHRKQLALMKRIADSLDVLILAHKLTLTRKEAAILSGYPLAHIERAIRANDLKATFTGKGVRVNRVDLVAYIERLTMSG